MLKANCSNSHSFLRGSSRQGQSGSSWCWPEAAADLTFYAAVLN